MIYTVTDFKKVVADCDDHFSIDAACFTWLRMMLREEQGEAGDKLADILTTIEELSQ